MNKHAKLPVAVVLSALALATILNGCRKKEKETAHAIPEVEVAEPVLDSITLRKSYPGTLKAHDWADVVGRVEGTMVRRLYNEGDYVTKGQPLISIESTKYRDAVLQAKASLETAQSQYDYYSKQYEAMKKAYESDAVSKMDVIQAEASMKQAQAAIMNATADLSIANTNLGYCTVTAPLSGYITSSDLNPGSFVSNGAVLATIVDNTLFDAEFEIGDAQYERILGLAGGLGNEAYRDVPVSFTVSLPHAYTANLDFTSPSVNESTGTLTLKGKVRNDHNELKNGMFVTISLPYGFDPQAILVKDAALSTDQLGKYLYVVNDSNKVVYTPVTVGDLYRDSLRVVEKGLRPGQRYVTRALLGVRPGMEVKPRLAAPAGSDRKTESATR